MGIIGKVKDTKIGSYWDGFYKQIKDAEPNALERLTLLYEKSLNGTDKLEKRDIWAELRGWGWINSLKTYAEVYDFFKYACQKDKDIPKQGIQKQGSCLSEIIDANTAPSNIINKNVTNVNKENASAEGDDYKNHVWDLDTKETSETLGLKEKKTLELKGLKDKINGLKERIKTINKVGKIQSMLEKVYNKEFYNARYFPWIPVPDSNADRLKESTNWVKSVTGIADDSEAEMILGIWTELKDNKRMLRREIEEAYMQYDDLTCKGPFGGLKRRVRNLVRRY